MTAWVAALALYSILATACLIVVQRTNVEVSHENRRLKADAAHHRAAHACIDRRPAYTQALDTVRPGGES